MSCALRWCGEENEAATDDKLFAKRRWLQRLGLAVGSDLSFFCFLTRRCPRAFVTGKLIARPRHAIGHCWTKPALNQKGNLPSLSENSSSASATGPTLPWIDADVQERAVRAHCYYGVLSCLNGMVVFKSIMLQYVGHRWWFLVQRCVGLPAAARIVFQLLLICRRCAVLGNAGAIECSGERRNGPHACLAALAVAAIKLERKASSIEKASITRILTNSGIIRDSLVSVLCVGWL